MTNGPASKKVPAKSRNTLRDATSHSMENIHTQMLSEKQSSLGTQRPELGSNKNSAHKPQSVSTAQLIEMHRRQVQADSETELNESLEGEYRLINRDVGALHPYQS